MTSEVAGLELTPPGARTGLRLWLGALRVQQWSKNLLVFVPLVLGHRWSDLGVLTSTAAAFMLLLAVTSATYLINDVLDADEDRRHATKRYRAVASGELTVRRVVLVVTAVLPTAILLAFAIGWTFGLLIVAYATTTTAYSLLLKRVPLLDAFVISVLFTLRLAMGSSFIDETPPLWLFTFAIFLFFSLAMAKRHTEVLRCRDVGGDSLASRGYEPGDWPITLAFGISAGIASLVVLAFYLVNEAFRAVGYSRPEFLWGTVALIAIWIGRIWLLTHRGKMDDDPVRFALFDRPGQLIGVVLVITFAVAL